MNVLRLKEDMIAGFLQGVGTIHEKMKKEDISWYATHEDGFIWGNWRSNEDTKMKMLHCYQIM